MVSSWRSATVELVVSPVAPGTTVQAFGAAFEGVRGQMPCDRCLKHFRERIQEAKEAWQAIKATI